MQKNWIGKSFGVEINFEILQPEGNKENKNILAFTTRPDTIFGATFLAIAPDHELSLSLSKKIKMY